MILKTVCVHGSRLAAVGGKTPSRNRPSATAARGVSSAPCSQSQIIINSLRGDRASLDMAAECAPYFSLDRARKMTRTTAVNTGSLPDWVQISGCDRGVERKQSIER